jgi:hypothetical protein
LSVVETSDKCSMGPLIRVCEMSMDAPFHGGCVKPTNALLSVQLISPWYVQIYTVQYMQNLSILGSEEDKDHWNGT